MGVNVFPMGLKGFRMSLPCAPSWSSTGDPWLANGASMSVHDNPMDVYGLLQTSIDIPWSSMSAGARPRVHGSSVGAPICLQ